MKNARLVSGDERYNTQLLYFTCSSLSQDDRYLYLISDRTGSPNVVVRDLTTGSEKVLTDNADGYLKSYVYFDGRPHRGLGKASVCLDAPNNTVYYLQGDEIRKAGLDGRPEVLARLPGGRMTAFTHVSHDGARLCVPTTDERCLEFDPETEGTGLDRRPVYDIDERVQRENLRSYLNIYDTSSGGLVRCEPVEKAWITHVQFHPKDSRKILYNHEWASFDCGIRRMWLFDGEKHIRLRTEGDGRSRSDWVCHEMWSADGRFIIYHGAYYGGRAFLGRLDMSDGSVDEIPLPEEYTGYGHFTCSDTGETVSDGYYRQPEDERIARQNSTDNGPDPHKKDAEYISVQTCDWKRHRIVWTPLCRHGTDWLGQDAHPHPIFSHRGDKIFFSSRNGKTVKVYCVDR